MGAVLREVQEEGQERDRATREAAMSPEELEAEHERFLSWIAAADNLPNMRRMVEAGVDPDAAETRDERFEFGLDCLLDGIAAQLPG
ncbi:MAG TPA: TetR/AcrR family transcriptional regulator C-terminal domain-containing protein, partial [Streptosporangiaceae bacterium]|nr:TetR/AcrR family transcriptional regulator C-terminal domain-containing protein [Streptosporangiaceae bacterium]